MTQNLCRALLVLAVPMALAAQQPGLEQAAATITPDDYAWRVGVIAHDSMQGRDTPSLGLDKTAEWIASEFRRMGLRGGAEDGGFIQQYPLTRVVVDAGASTLTGGWGGSAAWAPRLVRPSQRRSRDRFRHARPRSRDCRRGATRETRGVRADRDVPEPE